VHLSRHPFANFGKVVLNELAAALPDWDELWRDRAQET
jgi:hypothetical protein